MEFGLHNVELKLKERLHFSFFFESLELIFLSTMAIISYLCPFNTWVQICMVFLRKNDDAILLFCCLSIQNKRKGRSDFENLKANESIGWAVDVNDPRELSAKMLKK
jgi:hypothetical protein